MRYFIRALKPLRFCVLSLSMLSLMVGCDEDQAESSSAIEIITDSTVPDASVEDFAPPMDAEVMPDISVEMDAMVMDVDAHLPPVDAYVDAAVFDAAPEPPTGPIEPPEGTDGTPEEVDFDWSEISPGYISNLIPEEDLDWTDYPRYGTARLLLDTESDECVCFDVECSMCSRDNCSLETCTYDLNDAHTLTKYHVELRSMDNQDHAVRFEVNISADPPIMYTNIVDVLNRLERIPVEYWYGLQIITQFGRGIQFLHGSYFNGAAAYGSMNYIDTQTAELPTLLHELGHTFEQYTRIGDPPTLEPQSNILDPIWRHAIRRDGNRTSPYGSNNEWEDLAEFARIYALSMIEGSLPSLETFCPERYRIWRRILLNGALIAQ